jgi:G2/mitotic-specific cyclin 1/2
MRQALREQNPREGRAKRARVRAAPPVAAAGRAEYSDPDDDDDSLPGLDPPRPPALGARDVPHYADEIACHDQAVEKEMFLPADSLAQMQQTTGTTARERAAVVEFLIRVHSGWPITKGTLFNAVFCLDFALSRMPIPKCELPHLGVVCLWMCAKLRELHFPSVSDFQRRWGVSCDRETFVAYERRLVEVQCWSLEYPMADAFLTRFLRAITASDTLVHLAQFTCEVSLLHFEFNQFRRSVTALASILIAAALCRQLDLVPARLLLQCSHVEDLGDVLACAQLLARAVDRVLIDKNAETYAHMIAGTEFEPQLRPGTVAIEEIRVRLIQ